VLFPADAFGAEGDVSLAAEGATEVSVSRDGSVVGFVTTEQLAKNDRNDVADGYVVVRGEGGGVRAVTVPAEGQSPDGSSRGVEVSRDGSTVAFFSDATKLVEGDTNGREDVFVADVASGDIRRVNVNDLGARRTLASCSPTGRRSARTDGSWRSLTARG
jgi:hypothetical protein